MAQRSAMNDQPPDQTSPKALHHDLAVALGYEVQPGDACDFPHLAEIVSRCPRPRELNNYVALCVEIITYFSSKEKTNEDSSPEAKTIQSCIDALIAGSTQAYFRSMVHGSEARNAAVVQNVLLILGSWSLMPDYFIPHRGDSEALLQAYCRNTHQEYSAAAPLKESLPDLVRKSGLLPHSNESVFSMQNDIRLSEESLDTGSTRSLHPSLECLQITVASLNAFKLAHLGGIHIFWTNNLSRHMMLSKYAGKFYLELFALPSALSAGPDAVLSHTGISTDLMDSVRLSYSSFFNPEPSCRWHRYMGKPLGALFWCWCISCASTRLRNSELRKIKSRSSQPAYSSASPCNCDPELENLMVQTARGWKHEEFESLWPRIIALESHLARCKPWSFWVIFRDRRDSVQFWTFLFGTMILALTFFQVILGIAQVVGGFD